jgi:hypothetical protein
MLPDLNAQMTAEARQASQFVQRRRRIGADRRSDNSRRGIASALASQLCNRIYWNVSVCHQEVQKPGDDLRATNDHVRWETPSLFTEPLLYRSSVESAFRLH